MTTNPNAETTCYYSRANLNALAAHVANDAQSSAEAKALAHLAQALLDGMVAEAEELRNSLHELSKEID